MIFYQFVWRCDPQYFEKLYIYLFYHIPFTTAWIYTNIGTSVSHQMFFFLMKVIMAYITKVMKEQDKSSDIEQQPPWKFNSKIIHILPSFCFDVSVSIFLTSSHLWRFFVEYLVKMRVIESMKKKMTLLLQYCENSYNNIFINYVRH